VELRVLGPREVFEGEREIVLTGKPRALLAVLLVHERGRLARPVDRRVVGGSGRRRRGSGNAAWGLHGLELVVDQVNGVAAVR
jgi:hypothetical protein